jgi:uncharacterized cupin superfamily protein
MNKQKGTTVIDPATLTERTGSGYPAPFEEACMARSKVALGDAGGLTQYGVNLVTLQPGAWSAQRHWHSHEDEFVWVVSGELVLVCDAGETVLKPGMAGTAKAGVADGHHLINRSSTDAVYLEVGTREPSDACSYPDIDLHLEPDGESGHRFVTKSGEVY